MIPFACSGCGKNFQVKTEFAGRKTKCPKCGLALLVPTPPASTPRVAPSPGTPARSPAEVSKRPIPHTPGSTAVSDERAAPGGRRRSGAAILVVGAGLLLLIGVSVLATLWAAGLFSTKPEDRPIVQGPPATPVPPTTPTEKPKSTPTSEPPVEKPKAPPAVEPPRQPEPKPGTGVPPVAPLAPAGTGVQPQKGVWLGSIVGNEYSPIFAQFEVLGDGQTIGSIIFYCTEKTPAGLATPLYFEKNPTIHEGGFKATRGESEFAVTFTTPAEARCRAQLNMQILQDGKYIQKSIKGDFTAKPVPPKAKDGTYVGEFAKSDTHLPAFKTADKTYYLVMTGLKNESFDANDEVLKFMADSKNAQTIATAELVLLKIKTHQGLMEAAKQGRSDLLTDDGVKKLLQLVSDEKAPLSVRMMIAHKFGLVNAQFPLVLILQLCRHEQPPGKFTVEARKHKDKANRDVLIISGILPSVEAEAPKPAATPAAGAKEAGQAAEERWARAEYAELVFQLSKEQMDAKQMASIDPAMLPKVEGKGEAKISDKMLLATAKGLPPSALLPDGTGGLKVTLNILRAESNSWPAGAKALANEPMWGSAFVSKPSPGALAYNLHLSGKCDAQGVYRGKASGILANGTKFHASDFEMRPRRFGD